MHQLRLSIQGEEFDYGALKHALNAYAYPRDKITDLLKAKAIIRVKKGLYVFGPEWSRRPPSQELLANLIYGPSYLSLDYALSYYGLIPERVIEITSVTSKKNKTFRTPLGIFSYRHIHHQKYSIGVELHEFAPDCFFLMAGPEKALADKLLLAAAGGEAENVDHLGEFLRDFLRIEASALVEFDRQLLYRIAQVYRSRLVDLLFEFVMGLK